MAELVEFETFMQRHWDSLDSRTMEFSRFQLLLPHLQKNPEAAANAKFWSCGQGTACAVFFNGNLILGDIDDKSCEFITSEIRAETIRKISGPGRIMDQSIKYFEQSLTLFSEQIPLHVMMLDQEPADVTGAGGGRLAEDKDLNILTEWLYEFNEQAIAHQPELPMTKCRKICMRYIEAGNMAVWEQDNIPVSMASIVNTTPRYIAISLVYTPRKFRNKGYAAQTVRMLSQRIVENGSMACLYIDARNPVSRRCYEKIGFVVTGGHVETSNMNFES
ncbi:MAG: GNAT family N-acetyltransferase [Methyloligellaceae bacterium]